jgi:rubrerythrin
VGTRVVHASLAHQRGLLRVGWCILLDQCEQSLASLCEDLQQATHRLQQAHANTHKHAQQSEKLTDTLKQLEEKIVDQERRYTAVSASEESRRQQEHEEATTRNAKIERYTEKVHSQTQVREEEPCEL